jgi:hypothetical protein
MVDITFKAVHGDTNEWKFIIWTAETRQREYLMEISINLLYWLGIVSSCVWCNRKDRETSRALWNGVLKEATRHSHNFRIFDKKSSLLGVIADEGAQALGLADCLDDQRVNNVAISGITVTGQDLLLYIYKTCWVHYCRYILCSSLFHPPYVLHVTTLTG